MKDNKYLLTWIEKRENTTWDCEEYPFRIASATNFTVKHFELYDQYGDGKKFDGKFYAAINAMDFAKKIYKLKIKKGEFVPKKKEKVEKKKVIYNNIPIVDDWNTGDSASIERYFTPTSGFPIAAAPIDENSPPIVNTQPIISSTLREITLDRVLDAYQAEEAARNAARTPNAELAAHPIVSQGAESNIVLQNGSVINTSDQTINLSHELSSPIASEILIPLQVEESSEDLNEFDDFGGEETPW